MRGILFPPDHSAAGPNAREEWRSSLTVWRSVTRELMHYDDRLYDRPALQWLQTAFAIGFIMLFDETVYDADRRRYRLDELLDDAENDFGGFDAIVLWHAYPKIGFDSRNQFDFYRDTAGGLDGLRSLVTRCHERGVHVYVDYNPWDTGTRREEEPDADALARLMNEIDADAVFLDTMSGAVDEMRATLEAACPGVALESEHLLPVEQIDSHPASWAQGIPSGTVPGVLRNRWFERRHMQHRIKRWQRDHTDELHTAWMNGAGVIVWENVFGSDLRWSPRDRSILRAMLPIQRRYATLWTGEGWTPLVETDSDVICSSVWEQNGLRLWTVCNLSNGDYDGPLIRLDGNEPIYDLVRGVPLSAEDGRLVGSIRARGIGAIVSGNEAAFGGDFAAFLDRQRELNAHTDFDATPPITVEMLRSAPRTALADSAALPPGMVLVPGRAFDMQVLFQVRECGFYNYGVDGRPPLDLRFRNLHRVETMTRHVTVTDFALDRTPVTNAQFAAFLQATGYTPADAAHFLDHWNRNELPTALEDHPVVYVDLDDARAYAAWAGKRLPTEAEWQHAAQGFGERRYPWGNNYDPGRCNHGATGTTTPVTAYPQGVSPFGVLDLCGNVWELTGSERSNGRTRFCILKGGSYYRAHGSAWYADGGPQPSAFSAKFIRSWPALDRCATIGFRCAVDVSLKR